MREVSLYGPGGKPDWFWELNPAGTVPIVVSSAEDNNGKEEVFADSELILDAIGNGRIRMTGDTNDEEDGVSLLLTSKLSKEEEARVNQWRSTISEKLIPVGKSAVLGGSLSKLRSLLKEMNDRMVEDDDGPYLVGNRVTVADCAAFPFLWRIDQEFGIGGDDDDDDDDDAKEKKCAATTVVRVRDVIQSGMPEFRMKLIEC